MIHSRSPAVLELLRSCAPSADDRPRRADGRKDAYRAAPRRAVPPAITTSKEARLEQLRSTPPTSLTNQRKSPRVIKSGRHLRRRAALCPGSRKRAARAVRPPAGPRAARGLHSRCVPSCICASCYGLSGWSSFATICFQASLDLSWRSFGDLRRPLVILLGALSVDGRVTLPAQRGLPVLRVLRRWGGVGGQGAGRAISRACAVVITSAQGQAGPILSRRRRAVRTIRPTTATIRSRSRLGS